MNQPLVVVEGGLDAVEDARGELRSRGVAGVVEVQVDSAEAAAEAVLAALSGVAMLVHATAKREVIDRLCDDLRRLGRLEHRVGADPRGLLTLDQHALLLMLTEGATLGEAAAALHLSRRSADRRLAAARRSLEAGTTNAAVVAYRRRLATSSDRHAGDQPAG